MVNCRPWFYQGSCFPVARLKQQLRMANGLFDLAAKLFYPDLPFTYIKQSDISLPQYEPGRILKQFVQGRFPDIRPPLPGKLQPISLHYEGKASHLPMTRSKINTQQSLYALDSLVDFLTTTGLDASSLVILTPYTFNLEYIIKKPQYASLK